MPFTSQVYFIIDILAYFLHKVANLLNSKINSFFLICKIFIAIVLYSKQKGLNNKINNMPKVAYPTKNRIKVLNLIRNMA